MFKYLNRFTTASARGLLDYDLNDRTRNNGAKLIAKHFNTSVAQHLFPIKITTTWNALRSEVVNSIRITALSGLTESGLTRFASPNLSIYFDFYGVGVRCYRWRFSVHSPFIEVYGYILSEIGYRGLSDGWPIARDLLLQLPNIDN